MGWIVIACVCAGVWVYAVYREDRLNPEPVWLVLFAMLAGMAAVPVALAIEEVILRDSDAVTGPLLARVSLAMTVAGPIEESVKFLAVALLIWFQRHFDEPMDGIVYAAAAAAGFALVENFLFMRDDPASILARGPAATGAHILFAAFWGGALGHAKQMKGIGARTVILVAGLALGFVTHGLFDLATWSADHEITAAQARLAQVTLMVGCALFLRWRIRVALNPVTA